MPQPLSEAIRRVRSAVNEPTARFFTDTELTDWINDGLRDVSRRAEDLITYDQSINVAPYVPIPGQAAPVYPLLNDVIRIQRIEFVPLNAINQVYKLEPSTQNEMDQIWGTYQQNPSSYPQFWVTRGYPGGTGRNTFYLQVYPVPSQGGNLNVFYYRTPYRFLDPTANTGELVKTLDIIEGWDDMVITYATYKALQKTRNPEWKDRKAEYEEMVTQIVDVTRHFHDQASFMTYGTNMSGWMMDAW